MFKPIYYSCTVLAQSTLLHRAINSLLSLSYTQKWYGSASLRKEMWLKKLLSSICSHQRKQLSPT